MAHHCRARTRASRRLCGVERTRLPGTRLLSIAFLVLAGVVDQGARLPGAVSAASAKVAPLRNKTPRPEITSGAFLSANQSPLLAQSSRLTILATSLVRCAISENRRAL